MKSGLMVFALGVIGLAAAAAMVAPPASKPPPVVSVMTADSPPAATASAPPPIMPAPQPGGMVSHSRGSGPVTYGKSMPPPPIVAIPRIPGPADMMVATGQGGEVRTIRSFASNEACDEALASVRRTISNAFCVSTTMPPPEPEHGYLVEVHVESNEWVGLETYPSMAECQRVLTSRPLKAGIQSACTPKLH